jgi:hypothetical protein
LLHTYKAIGFTIKESSLYIYLMQFPTKYRSKRNDCTKWCIPGYWCTNLIIVCTLFLETIDLPLGLGTVPYTVLHDGLVFIQHGILQLVSFIKQRRFSVINITYQSNITCKPLRPFSFSESS